MKKMWIVGKNISKKNYSKCVKVDLVPPLWIERGGGSNIYIHQCCRFHLFTCVHIPYTAMPPSQSGKKKPCFVRHEQTSEVCISAKLVLQCWLICSYIRISRPCQIYFLWAKVSFSPCANYPPSLWQKPYFAQLVLCPLSVVSSTANAGAAIRIKATNQRWPGIKGCP